MIRLHRHARTTLSCIIFATALDIGASASSANAAPKQSEESVSYLDGARRMTVIRNGPASPDARGRTLWPIQIINGRHTIDSFVDQKALVHIDPEKRVSLAALHLRIVENLMPSIGIYSVESLDGENGLDIAVRLANRDQRPAGLHEAIPNLYLRLQPAGQPFVPNDPEFLGQWYFDEKRLQMADVWGISQGDPQTTIVVIDTGCDMTHPDLVEKLDEGLDVIDNDNDPSYDPAFTDSPHGTSCAGLVGATTNNSLGISGACPQCRIRCVRLLTDMPVPIDAHIKAFNFAFDTKAAVVSNSWGFTDASPVPTLMRNALDNLFDNGRGGKGALVFFAAGNDNREIGDQELQAVRGVTAIGAINQFYDKTFFTNYGNSLDLVAPVGTLTTDLVGAPGYDPSDYTTNFGGTSSACPVAAGVAGVVMSAIPDKTSAEVLDVLVRTAKPAPYASPDANGHDPVFGFGIINPLAALKNVLGLDNGADAGPGGSTPPTDESCSCRAAGQTPTSRSWTFGIYAALFAAFVIRRRRR